MARTTINPNLPEGALMLKVVSAIEDARALNSRACNIWDYTRAGADFTALAAALGCTAQQAEALYSRFRSIETAMNGIDFQNLAEIDQG
jgi:hypothetical protein